jgi:SNF2 family DNA or RNA helicase
MRLDAAKHLDLPELVHNEIRISIPDKVRRVYDDIERDFFAELDSGEELLAQSSTAKYLLCRQMASGSYYDPDNEDKRVTIPFHKSKSERLLSLIEELHGKPLLVAYVYRSDLEQIQKDHRKKYPSIGGHTSEKQARQYLDQWNRRELPVLLAQCSSISHGLNMQAGGNDLCFYSLTDNLEDYEQLIRRIYRRGVKGQVRVHYLLARGTIDSAVYRRIKTKETNERSLLEAKTQCPRCKWNDTPYCGRSQTKSTPCPDFELRREFEMPGQRRVCLCPTCENQSPYYFCKADRDTTLFGDCAEYSEKKERGKENFLGPMLEFLRGH